MRCNYDIFDKFADGSTIWRACVRGQFEANRKVRELRELSENEFLLIDIPGRRVSLLKTEAQQLTTIDEHRQAWIKKKLLKLLID
jgi:hypothetical protein